MESPTPQFTPVETPKKSNTPLIIGIVVAVLLCCCCLVLVGVGLYLRSQVGDVYSSINQQLTAMPNIPSVPAGTAEPSNPSDTPVIPSNLIPQGGLGDEVLRANTWGYVLAAAAISGCTATDASKTNIEVLEQPDSAGIWKEKWTVTCDDGAQKSFDVLFTPSKQGGTDINVTSSK